MSAIAYDFTLSVYGNANIDANCDKKVDEELIEYCDEKINNIEEVVSEVSDEDKPRVILLVPANQRQPVPPMSMNP